MDKRKHANGRHIADHRRQWRDFLYVYPVLARRSKGLSIGVNLNPDKRCTYSCIYCQIDRHISRNLHTVDLDVLRRELEMVVGEAASGEIWRHERFAAAPPQLRRINDIAFSGDGEPTCLANFDKAVAIAADVKRAVGLDEVKIVVITNATQFDSEQFRLALPILDANNGEIWAKLDAGSEEYFQRVNRPAGGMTLEKIVENIIAVAKGRPLVIQSLFPALDGQPPGKDEISAYCSRLNEIIRNGGRIKLVQIHTVARRPAEPNVSALDGKTLDDIAAAVRKTVKDVAVETYYGG